MKKGPHIAIATKFLVSVLIGIYSCTSSQDIYQNPYQSGIKTSGGTSYSQNSFEGSPGGQPEWIYAVSSDFYVGYGQGNSVMEAKYAALNDIKAFITKSLGETGRVKEVTIVNNTITGPNKTSGREDYMLKYDFENKYHPVVHISFSKLEDYYYESSGYKARYYIKYGINEAELQRIKEEFRRSLIEEKARITLQEKKIQESLQLEKARKIKTKHLIDSITSFQGLLSIESLIDRYNGITDFIYEHELDNQDSLRLFNELRNLKGFLNGVDITVLEHNQDESLRFGLISSNTILSTGIQPILRSNGIKVENLVVEDGIWNLKYTVQGEGNSSRKIFIAFELPYDRIESEVEVSPIVSQPEIQIVDKILFSNLEQNRWTGKLSSIRVGFNIRSNSREIINLTNLDLVLHIENASNPAIHVDSNSLEIIPGLNRVVRQVDCQLPSRFFVWNEMTCDLKLALSQNGSIQIHNLYNVPIIINR